MFSEVECGVCYRTYNAARRCPRELHCRHTFCESCLRAMSRPVLPGANRSIDCPLCRHTTTLSSPEGNLKSELRVDESALERLVAAGVLEQEEDEEEEDGGEVPECEGEVPQTETEESDSSAGHRGGRFRRSLMKVWMKISGQSDRRRPDGCMTSDELRSMAMMANYMF